MRAHTAVTVNEWADMEAVEGLTERACSAYIIGRGRGFDSCEHALVTHFKRSDTGCRSQRERVVEGQAMLKASKLLARFHLEDRGGLEGTSGLAE